MYVNNVRKSIDGLSDHEYNEYLNRLRMILKKQYHKNVKPAELKKRVDEFVGGKDPKIESFEAYLHTFDELSINGAINAIQNNHVRLPISWRGLLLKVTEDRTLSADVIKHLDDEQILIEIKAMYYNCIEYCKDEKKDRFFNNLHTFNNFIRINRK